MAEETNGNGAAAANPAQPALHILTQYVRDLSFENIAALKGVASEGKPDVRVQAFEVLKRIVPAPLMFDPFASDDVRARQIIMLRQQLGVH